MKYGSNKSKAAALAAVTALTVVLSACSGSQSSNSEATVSPESTGNAGAAETPADGKIVSEPLTLTDFVQMSGNPAPGMKSFNDMAAYKETEKLTGIHIDFQHPTVGQEKNQFNLLMSSGKYPDIIEWGWGDYPGGGVGAMNAGVIIPLNDYIEKYAPNLTKLLADNPDIRKDVSTDDGRIYAFPFLRSDPYLRTYQGLAIRQDWLDTVGLQMPTTIDEWHNVLKAFKEKDPNGNGKPDEIPLLIAKDTLLNFSNVFLNAWGTTGRFNLQDGKVVFGPIQPAYKEFLQTLRSWYEEGLIDRDYAGTDGKQKDAKWTGDVLGASELAVGGGIGKYTTAMAAKNPKFNLAGAPYPTLNKGDKPVLGQREPIFNGVGAAITKDNKHVVETVKWLDFKYGEQGHMLFNFGIEGKSYELKDGYPTYTDEIMKNPDGLAFATAIGQYAVPFGGPFVQDMRYQEQNASLPQQKEALNTWMAVDNDGLLPPLTFTNEESSRLAAIMADVNTYRDEMFDKFVMGAEPLEHFDNFVKTIQGMGIQEALEIEQAAYDRYLKR
ncbi:extracellular solute-binding protein [Paenibacillus sp. JDR-2]|uniref:extracellular solute-binding protein n=1 Tax=Paenibacillus sp. (strain JDR-2) TaxID=324057 RepID=UPI0001667B6A|nr:extracellular solute-binding protein [Paenibacillus sp. JDR-2]ACT04457.1 extracellular solute-binding protein family 1 [Paenibacillus sp. JDR-2]